MVAIRNWTDAGEGHFDLAGTPFDVGEFGRLWLVALATYGVGDIVTTLALTGYSPTVTEANALVRLAVDLFGYWGLAGVKLVAFFVALAVTLYGANVGDRLLYYLPPGSLVLVGTFTTTYNLRLMIG